MNSTNLTGASEEWPFFDRFDKRAHCHCVMVLVGHDRWALAMST